MTEQTPSRPSPSEPPSAGVAGREPTLRVVTLRGGRVSEWEGEAGLAEAIADPAACTWIDLIEPTPGHVAAVAGLLGLHPLIAEDIVEGNQRAKIEVTERLVHIVMFALDYTSSLQHTEIDFVLGERFLLSVHSGRWNARATGRLRDDLPSVLERGADHLLWGLVDAIVDAYFPCIDRLGDEIDDVQDQVIARATPAVLQRLFDLKRELLAARRATAPVREIFNQLTNRDLALIDHEEIIYFRDVYDHLIRLTDELDTYRELASGTLDAYLSTVNNNLSVIMKRLTGVTVILAGVGAVAGVFGMSEAGTAFAGGEATGFWLVSGFAVLLAIGAAAFLRRIDWI